MAYNLKTLSNLTLIVLQLESFKYSTNISPCRLLNVVIDHFKAEASLVEERCKALCSTFSHTDDWLMPSNRLKPFRLHNGHNLAHETYWFPLLFSFDDSHFEFHRGSCESLCSVDDALSARRSAHRTFIYKSLLIWCMCAHKLNQFFLFWLHTATIIVISYQTESPAMLGLIQILNYTYFYLFTSIFPPATFSMASSTDHFLSFSSQYLNGGEDDSASL